MPKKKVLFISGSLGLGHASRDLVIAKELRRQGPEMEIAWLAGPPANKFLKEAGETLHPENDLYADDTGVAEKSATEGFRLNLLKYLTHLTRGGWKQNVEVFERVTSNETFDIIIADEAYEIGNTLMNKTEMRDRIGTPFVMIYDFVGNFSMSWNPVEKLGVYLWNREWAKIIDFFSDKRNTALFVGEPEDIPHKSLGFQLPTCRDIAEKSCHFTGYVLPFNPSQYVNREILRARHGYGEEPLVICSIGGTSVGKDLLSLCGRAYPIMKEQIPDLHMVLVCGPRLSPNSLNIPEGVEAKSYVPALYEHFAASDLAILQAGGTSTLELTALNRPFLYFPLEGHWEQQIHVAGRLARHKAGVPMRFAEVTPEILAKTAIENIGKDVSYASINTNGAKKAAIMINQIVSRYL